MVGLSRLVRQWGHRDSDLVALAFLLAPITLIAATSSTDFIWAIAFFLWAAIAHLRGHSVVAGALGPVVGALARDERERQLLELAAQEGGQRHGAA